MAKTPDPTDGAPTPAAAVTVTKRARLGRGSARRITRNTDTLTAAIDAFCKDMDFDVYQVDDEGNRVGKWPVLESLAKVRDAVREEVNYVLHPESRPAEADAADAT